MSDYEKIMRCCIKLAKKGRGKTSPNPLVGCVVLDKIGNVLATGYHHKYGENHAEREALLKLKKGEERGGTLIVNLEPCSHFGKTPPCADLIIERGIKKVVIGCKDSNEKVNGSGIEKLKHAGIEVICGVLEKECRELNKMFFVNFEQNRVYVALKTASTIDGKIASKTGDSKWITSEKSRTFSRKIRGYYDAILTSSSTVIADNPQMIHKTNIILDSKMKTDFNSKIYKNNRIIVVTSKDIKSIDKVPDNVEILKVKTKNGRIDLKDMLSELFKLGIKSIFVEAGGELSGAFVREDLVDEIYYFMAPKILNDNNGKSCFNGDEVIKISGLSFYELDYVKKIGNDVLIHYKKQ